jgi:hypothetical protein
MHFVPTLRVVIVEDVAQLGRQAWLIPAEQVEYMRD